MVYLDTGDMEAYKTSQRVFSVLMENQTLERKDAVQRGWQYAYRDRRQKRNFRRLWIIRINVCSCS